MPASEPVQLARVERRRSRERRVIDTTRALFDKRGMQDAPMEEIAKAAGIPRALIYRHFESEEELFVLTVTRYLDEITALGVAAVDPHSPRGAAAVRGGPLPATAWSTRHFSIARCR